MPDNLIVKTNNVPRLIVDAYELSADERTEFDYIDWSAVDDGRESADFMRYKGQLYHLAEFTSTRGMPEFSPLVRWDGVHNDSFFSGIVVRYCEDHDYVVAGTFFA